MNPATLRTGRFRQVIAQMDRFTSPTFRLGHCAYYVCPPSVAVDSVGAGLCTSLQLKVASLECSLHKPASELARSCRSIVYQAWHVADQPCCWLAGLDLQRVFRPGPVCPQGWRKRNRSSIVARVECDATSSGRTGPSAVCPSPLSLITGIIARTGTSDGAGFGAHHGNCCVYRLPGKRPGMVSNRSGSKCRSNSRRAGPFGS